MIRRAVLRCMLVGALFIPGSAISQDRVLSPEQAALELVGGGFVLMMRHASTVPGTGDPEGFDVARCETQRNLSDAGRRQARDIGQKLIKVGIRFSAVRNSQWCRCRETAALAFGESDDWTALNSFFADRRTEPRQSRELHQAAGQIATETNVIWVTHQVNISAALGRYTSQGEIIAARVIAGKLKPVFRIRL